MKTAQEIIDFFNRYKGFDHWWEDIDGEDQIVILKDLDDFLKKKLVLHCADCEHPLKDGYCYKCDFAPSMQDTYLA